MIQSSDSEDTTLTPDDAFAVLGNETRIQILRTLGETDEPVSFTELRERIGIRQGAQFNYHLDKLVGHFVRKTDRGYELDQAGRRVMQAILSGAVTQDSTLDPTEIDFSCRYCGSPIEVSYSDGRMRMTCRDCGGTFEDPQYQPAPERKDGTFGNIGNLPLPPAGIQGRTAADVMRAAATVAHLEAKSAASDVCPRCAAPVEQSIASVCGDHDASSGPCPHCNHRLAVRLRFRCTNCIYERATSPVMALHNNPTVLSFAADHGLNGSDRGIEWGWDYDETVLSTEPLKARFRFTIEDETLVVTVDDNLSVIDAVRESAKGEAC